MANQAPTPKKGKFRKGCLVLILGLIGLYLVVRLALTAVASLPGAEPFYQGVYDLPTATVTANPAGD